MIEDRKLGSARSPSSSREICSVDQIFSEWLIDIFDNKKLTQLRPQEQLGGVHWTNLGVGGGGGGVYCAGAKYNIIYFLQLMLIQP